MEKLREYYENYDAVQLWQKTQCFHGTNEFMSQFRNNRNICIFCTASIDAIKSVIEVNRGKDCRITLFVPKKSEIEKSISDAEIDIVFTDIDHFDYQIVKKENRIFGKRFEDIYILGTGQREWSDYVECVCIAHRMMHINLYFFQDGNRYIIWDNGLKHKLKNKINDSISNSIYCFILCYTKFTSKICGYKW